MGKKIIGAVLGVVLVTALWFTFKDDAPRPPETEPEVVADAEQGPEADEKPHENVPAPDEKEPEMTATSRDEGEETPEESAGEEPSTDEATGVESPREPEPETPPEEETPPSEEETQPSEEETDPVDAGEGEAPPAEMEGADQEPGETEPAGPTPVPEPSSEPFPETSSDAVGRQDIWEYFNTRKKADKFAEYVTSISGVDCKARKARAGRYQVYFEYEDEVDRKAKIAMIEEKGLKLDLDGAPPGEEPAAEVQTVEETQDPEAETADDAYESEEPAISEGEPAPPVSDRNHQEIWTPFNAKGKAKGFAERIKTISGVDCHVKKTGPGRHQVYFFYEDELDRKAKIAMIEEAGVPLGLDGGASE